LHPKLTPASRSHIHGRTQIATELKQQKVASTLSAQSASLHETHHALLSASSATHADARRTGALRARAEQAALDTLGARAVVDAFRAGQPGPAGAAGFPQAFFERVCAEMEGNVRALREAMELVERRLGGAAVQAQVQGTSPQGERYALPSTLLEY
jgi:hypothetical protein